MGIIPCCSNLGISEESSHEANQQVIIIIIYAYAL
jgi:hypothetical protein